MKLHISHSLIIALAIAFIACSPKNETVQENKIIEIEGFSLPEGACSDGQNIYISNVGVEFKPLDKDGDGFISKLSPDGKIIELHYLPTDDTLHSPKGMGVIGNTLYVTDIDRVVGYDLTSRKKVYELFFTKENTVLLNDIVVKDSNTIFVSGMDIGKLFEVKIDSPSYKEIIKLPKPNGLWWNKEQNTLYIGLFGREDKANGDKGDIGKIDFTKDTITWEELTNYQGNIDGVTLVGDKIYYTDWLAKGDKGTLKTLDLKSGENKEVTELSIDGPGDFYLDEKTGKVWLPKMRENKLLIIDIN